MLLLARFGYSHPNILNNAGVYFAFIVTSHSYKHVGKLDISH